MPKADKLKNIECWCLFRLTLLDTHEILWDNMYGSGAFDKSSKYKLHAQAMMGLYMAEVVDLVPGLRTADFRHYLSRDGFDSNIE